MACSLSEDSYQHGHPFSLIRVIAVGMEVGRHLPSLLSADAQADLSLRWLHMPLCWLQSLSCRGSYVKLCVHI